MQRKVTTSIGEIVYELERKKVKNLNLRVRNDGTVHLSIPYYVSYEKADKFVADNRSFVFDAIKKVAERNSRLDTHAYFLGKKLNIEILPSSKTGGGLSGDTLVLFAPDSSNDFPKASLEQWQMQQAKEILPKALSLAYDRFAAAGLKVPFPSLTIRFMTSRWGSCTCFKKKITLNALLIEKPFICAEQVACHELAHFLVQNHSADFYKVLDIVMPEHRAVNRILKKIP